MFRTALLVLALTTGGGALHLDRFLDLVGGFWAAGPGGVGNILDPNGAVDNGDAGGHADPDGAVDNGDVGNQLDPDG
jgi:hypothetical protein